MKEQPDKAAVFKKHMPPTIRVTTSPKKAGFCRQCEIHHGTKPATNPGAMTRKIADPTIARTFLTIS
jgi:hypothetical protein